MSRDRKYLHETFLYPVVRIRAEKVGGSGTIIYSKPTSEGSEEYETFVLTNWHVISDLLKVEKVWDPQAGVEIKRETRGEPFAEFFQYKHLSRVARTPGTAAEIMAWDEPRDLALLRLKDPDPATFVAKLVSREEFASEKVAIFDRIFAIGCGMGERPIVTDGRIAQFERIIENMPYIITTAPTIFGNSGGAVYHQDLEALLGVTARIAVVVLGMGGSAIPHLSYTIPITTVYEFFDEQYFRFLYDPAFTSAGEAEERKRLRELARRAFLGGRVEKATEDEADYGGALPHGVA